MSTYFDRQGNEMTMGDWIAKFEDPAYHSLCFDAIPTGDGDNVDVSTVWLGLDHSFVPGGKPVIFETMVFGGELDQECEHYQTEDNARAGHAKMVARVQRTVSD